jgi:hypothetical protein
MSATTVEADLDALWESLPSLLEQSEDDWALKAVLADGVAGYTREHSMPRGVMIRHNPDGTRELVRINWNAPDTVLRTL